MIESMEDEMKLKLQLFKNDAAIKQSGKRILALENEIIEAKIIAAKIKLSSMETEQLSQVEVEEHKIK